MRARIQYIVRLVISEGFQFLIPILSKIIFEPLRPQFFFWSPLYSSMQRSEIELSQASSLDPSQITRRDEELAEKGAMFRDFLTSRVRLEIKALFYLPFFSSFCRKSGPVNVNTRC